MSTFWHDDDIPTLLAAVGAVPVVIDGFDGIGTLDWNDELMTADGTRAEVIVGVPVLTIQSSAFPTVHVDSVVECDGVTYTVEKRLKYGDGATTKLFLGDATGAEIPQYMVIDGGAFDGTGGIGPPVMDGGAFDGTGGAGPSADGGGF